MAKNLGMGRLRNASVFFASHCQHKLVMAKSLGKAGILGRFRHAFVSLASDGKKKTVMAKNEEIKTLGRLRNVLSSFSQ